MRRNTYWKSNRYDGWSVGMLKLKKRTTGVVFDWLLFFLILYIMTDNLVIVLYLSKTYSILSHFIVFLISLIAASMFINIYTIIFPNEIYLDNEKIYFKKFIGIKEMPLENIKIVSNKNRLFIFKRTQKIKYNKDAAFISRIKYKDNKIFIEELHKRVNSSNK